MMRLSPGLGRWLIDRGCKPADTHTHRDPNILPVHGATAPPEDVMQNFTFNDLLKEGNAKQIWGQKWIYFTEALRARYDFGSAAVEFFVRQTAYPGTVTPPNKSSD